MGRRNKRQRQLDALAQACRAQSGKNEVLDIDDDDADSGDDKIEIDMESFSSVIKSNLRTRPVYYYGDSDRTKRRRRSEIDRAAKLTGQDLFAAWGITNPAEESKVPVVRKYNKTTHTDDDILKALELISEVCDSLKNKRRIKRAAFSLDTPYNTLRVLAIRDYINFLSKGLLKGESATLTLIAWD